MHAQPLPPPAACLRGARRHRCPQCDAPGLAGWDAHHAPCLPLILGVPAGSAWRGKGNGSQHVNGSCSFHNGIAHATCLASVTAKPNAGPTTTTDWVVRKLASALPLPCAAAPGASACASCATLQGCRSVNWLAGRAAACRPAAAAPPPCLETAPSWNAPAALVPLPLLPAACGRRGACRLNASMPKPAPPAAVPSRPVRARCWPVGCRGGADKLSGQRHDQKHGKGWGQANTRCAKQSGITAIIQFIPLLALHPAAHLPAPAAPQQLVRRSLLPRKPRPPLRAAP